MRLMTTTLALLAAGCASKPSTYVYVGAEQLDSFEQQMAFDRVDPACREHAQGGQPMPIIEPYQGRETIRFRVRYADGSTTSGTATYQPGAGESFAQGVQTGMALGAAVEAKERRQDAYERCMRRNGFRPKIGEVEK